MGSNESVGIIYEYYETMQNNIFDSGITWASLSTMEFMKYIKSTAKSCKYFLTTLDITIKVKI